MGANKCPNLQKCGEILVDLKSKNRKNKMYIFLCTFCNIQYDQLKKFSLHLGEEHLNNLDDILNESELKFEAETEQVSLQTFNNFEAPDVKVFENSIVEKINVNPDPLDTVNTTTPAENNDILNCEIKNELQENLNRVGPICDNEEMEWNDSNNGSNDNEVNEKVEISKTSVETSRVFQSESEDDIEDDLDQMPLKKRKVYVSKKGKKSKRKEKTNERSSDDSKDAEYNDNHIGNFDFEKALKVMSSKSYRKELRNSGKAYISKAGKVVFKRQVRDLENCKTKCKEKISKKQQEIIFKNYWNLGLYHLRQMFIANLIDVQGTQRKQSKSNASRRHFTFKYFLEVSDKRISVCQKCFRYTLCETEQFIRTTVKKKIAGTVEFGDCRGKHGSRRILAKHKFY